MTTSFPGALDSFTNPEGTDKVATVDHAAQHANANDAIEALQAKVGADGSEDTDSHDYKLSDITGSDKAVPDSAVSNVDNTSDAEKNAAMAILENKTIDANDNLIENLDLDNFDPDAIVTDAEGITSNDNNTTIPTSAAVKAFVDANAGGSPIKVRAYNSGHQNSSSGGKVTLDSESYDPTSAFASSTFTAPENGFYLVIGNILFQSAESTERIYRAHLRVNGSEVAQAGTSIEGSTASAGVSVSQVLQLSANDTVELYQSTTATSHTSVVRGGAAGTSLTVVKL